MNLWTPMRETTTSKESMSNLQNTFKNLRTFRSESRSVRLNFESLRQVSYRD